MADQPAREVVPAPWVVGVERDMLEPAEKSAEPPVVDILRADVIAHRLLDQRGVALAAQIAARCADDPAVWRQLIVGVAVIHPRHQLAPRQIPGAAEHH